MSDNRQFPILESDDVLDVYGYTVLISATRDPKQVRVMIIGTLDALLQTQRFAQRDAAIDFANEYVLNQIERNRLPSMAA